MTRDLKSLTEREFDLVVVGGGIAGVCIAWDAALRGLSVALIERDDFSGATSAHSLKFVHGGIRYLQHADIPRVRESCHERSAFLRIAPHLVHPLAVVIPAYGHGIQGKGALFAAFRVLSLLTLDRNRGIADPERQIPTGRILSRAECLRLFPEMARQDLTGAGLFHDGQMYSPPRLVISILRSAIESGAVTANYCEVRGFLESAEGRVGGVQAVDTLSGDPFEVRAKLVVNAAGPFAEELLVRSGLRQRRAIPLSRDLAIVVRRLFEPDMALAVQTKYRDPDALISRGNRHLFVVPWREYTLIGVNSKVYTGNPSELEVPEEEVQGFVDEFNETQRGPGIRLEDVSTVNAGLLPFGENASEATDLSFGKRSVVIDHAGNGGPDGLVTVMSVRYTTGRSVAQRAVDLALGKLEMQPQPCATTTTPAFGGDFERFEGLFSEARRRCPTTMADAVVRQLCHNYGSAYPRVLELVETDPALGRTVGESNVLLAEVVHAVRDEMALKLSDVVLRRTDLGAGADPGDEALAVCAERMGSELGWTPEDRQREIDEVKVGYPNWPRGGVGP